jgi:plasmid stabilization system protein ParE
MNVHWTEAALADLRAIQAYISRHSSQYATSLIERLFDRSAQLANHPRLGGVVPEYDEESLREILEHPYRIIDRILEQQVDIVAVIHGARRLPRGL